jgi:hypothetical protein
MIGTSSNKFVQKLLTICRVLAVIQSGENFVLQVSREGFAMEVI